MSDNDNLNIELVAPDKNLTPLTQSQKEPGQGEDQHSLSFSKQQRLVNTATRQPTLADELAEDERQRARKKKPDVPPLNLDPVLESAAKDGVELGDKQAEQPAEAEAEASAQPPVGFHNDGMWSAFNKYVYSLVLLFMATAHFNLLGLFYFLLFIFHTFAYYAFRTTDFPIDYLLDSRRRLNINIRTLFAYLYILVSTLAFVGIITLKIMLYLSGQDSNPLDNRTDTDNEETTWLNFFALMIPDFDSIFTLLTAFVSFFMAVVLLQTLKKENQEAVQMQFTAAQFSNLAIAGQDGEEMPLVNRQKNLLKKAEHFVKDYNFKQEVLLALQFCLLAILSAATRTLTNTPYQLIMLSQGLVLTLGSMSTFKRFSVYLNRILVILLVVDLVTMYVILIFNFPEDGRKVKDYAFEVFGFIQNPTSYTIFGLKILLFALECQRMSFAAPMADLKFKACLQEQVNQRIARERKSYTSKILTPISQFSFCGVAILFALLHPSILFVPMLPLLILGFFSDVKSPRSLFRCISKFFICSVVVFIIALYSYQLVDLFKEDNFLIYLVEITGLVKDKLVMRELFPKSQEFLFFGILTVFCKYANDQKEEKKEQQPAEGDSEPRDKSLPAGESAEVPEQQPGLLLQNQQQEDLSVISRFTDDNQSMRSKQSIDETTRGRFQRYSAKVFNALSSFYSTMVNYATIHSTKLALLTLFIVSAFNANLPNLILFVMFILLAMSNNTQVLGYWRLTLGLVSTLITAQYCFHVFLKKETEINKEFGNGILCLSGMLLCTEKGVTADQLEESGTLASLLVYMPYYVLLLVFVLAYFILTSESYKYLLDHYINEEIKMKKPIKYSSTPPVDQRTEIQLIRKELTDLELKRIKDELEALEADVEPLLSKEKSSQREKEDEKKEDEKKQIEKKEDEKKQIEQKEETSSEDQKLREQLRNSVVMCDPVTRFFIKNGIYLLLATMAFVSTTLPLSLTNAVLLFFMTILVTRALTTKSQVDLYTSSRTLLIVLNIFTLISLALRYSAQFLLHFFPQKISTEESEASGLEKWMELLVGLKQDFFAIRLLSLTLILIISNLQLKVMQNQVLIQILLEQDSSNWNHASKTNWLKKLGIYMAFFACQILPVGLLAVLFLVACVHQTLLGLVAAFTTVTLLSVHSGNFWRHSYKAIGITTQVFVFVMYSLDLIMVIWSVMYKKLDDKNKSENSDDFIQNVIRSNLNTFDDEDTFFTSLLWLFVIVAVCFAQQLIGRFGSFFTVTVLDAPVASPLLDDKQEEAPKIEINDKNTEDKIVPLDKGEEAPVIDKIIEASQDLISQKSSQTLTKEQLIYAFEEPIRHCLWFKSHIADVFMFSHGVTFTLLMCAFTMLYKLNITSLVYLVVFFRIYKVGYYPSRFESTQTDPEQIEKRLKVNSGLTWLIGMISLVILCEYVAVMAHGFSRQVEGEEEENVKAGFGASFITNYLCYVKENPARRADKSSGCLEDWNNWLSMGKDSVPLPFFFCEFALLLITYMTRFFTSEAITLSSRHILPEPVLDDKYDFTAMKSEEVESVSSENSRGERIKSKRSWKLILDKLTFSFFPYLLLTVLFLAVACFNDSSFSDLIACGYLVQTFYLVTKFRRLYTKNFNMLTKLRQYNTIVLTLYLLFQVPLLLCPGVSTDNLKVKEQIPDDVEGEVEGQEAESVTTSEEPLTEQPFFYIPASECTLHQVGRGYHSNTWVSLYIVLAQSVGLKKFALSSVPYSFLFIVLTTEIQAWAFHHPYFKAYVLRRLENTKLDSRLRGFMMVERFHLSRKWAYKAIKQQIQILHDRLMRITKEYNQMLNNYTGFLAEEHRSEEVSVERVDKTPVNDSTLLIGETSPQEDLLDSILEQKQFKEQVESVALQLLKSNFPVISLARFKLAVREAILERQESFIGDKQAFDKQSQPPMVNLDTEDFKELLLSLISRLQKEVYTENRVSLYNKEGIGLHFAVTTGCCESLDYSEYAFYYNLFVKQHDAAIQLNDEENAVDAANSCFGNSSSSSNSENRSNEGRQDQSPVAEASGVPRTPEQVLGDEDLSSDQLEFYSELKQTLDELRQVQDKETPVSEKISIYLRQLLWKSCTNKLIFYSLYDKQRLLVNKGSLSQIPLSQLMQATIISQTENICFAIMFINFAFNANLISVFLPISALFYAMLENPKPSHRYWRFVTTYMLVVISMKFIYQLPIFCSSPLFSIYGCLEQDVPQEVLVNRADYIIGLQKFTGPASFPKDQGVFRGLVWDILLLVMLVNLKNYLLSTGQWNFVRTDSDIHKTPKFKCLPKDLTEAERADLLKQHLFYRDQYSQLPLHKKALFKLESLFQSVKEFTFKLLPRYMSKLQPNRDLRTQQDQPACAFNPNKVKPGKDYFNGNFFSLLAIFLYVLFFYKSMIRNTKSEIAATMDMNHFSTAQVTYLFALMLLMMFERMLYRIRNSHWGTESAQQQVVGTDMSQHVLTIKLSIYVILVVGLHTSLGFVLPMHLGTKLGQSATMVIFYLLWVVHFVFAGLQIKHGYPQAPYKQTFMRDTSVFKVTLFRVYKAIPFLWEMKVIIDWTVTSTCLDLFQWFRLDDAFNYIYFNKYQSDMRRKRPEFAPRETWEKFFIGFCFAFGLIILILAPILLFSGINPILIPNPVKGANLNIKFELNNSGNEYNIFHTQAVHVHRFNEENQDAFYEYFDPVDSELDPEFLQRVAFTTYSESNWLISEPSMQRLAKDFTHHSTLKGSSVLLTSTWDFIREAPVGRENARGVQVTSIPIANFKPFIDLMLGETATDDETESGGEKAVTSATIKVAHVFPKILRLGATAMTTQLEVQPMKPSIENKITKLTAINLTLQKTKNNVFYWTFDVPTEDPTGLFLTGTEDENNEKDLAIVVYNDKVISSMFASAMSLSVVGVYVTIVFAVGRFLRIMFDRYSEKVIYEELPNTQKLTEICEGIFIAQLEGDMVTEKKLYDLLITVYRSPELMLKMTGYKQRYLPDPAFQQHQAEKNSDPHRQNFAETAEAPRALNLSNNSQKDDRLLITTVKKNQ